MVEHDPQNHKYNKNIDRKDPNYISDEKIDFDNCTYDYDDEQEIMFLDPDDQDDDCDEDYDDEKQGITFYDPDNPENDIFDEMYEPSESDDLDEDEEDDSTDDILLRASDYYNFINDYFNITELTFNQIESKKITALEKSYYFILHSIRCFQTIRAYVKDDKYINLKIPTNKCFFEKNAWNIMRVSRVSIFNDYRELEIIILGIKVAQEELEKNMDNLKIKINENPRFTRKERESIISAYNVFEGNISYLKENIRFLEEALVIYGLKSWRRARKRNR